MDNYQIALCVVSVLLVLSICVMIYYYKHAVKCSVSAFDFMKLYESCSADLSNAKSETFIADTVAKSANAALKEATDQLKQIQDLRMSGKKSMIELMFDDGDGLSTENIEADKIVIDEFLAVLYNEGKAIASMDRDRFVLHKYYLVDIDNGEEKK